MADYHGQANGAGRRVCIVVSRFNAMVTDRLIEGAREELLRRGVADSDVDIVRVPGAWEIPLAAARAAQGSYDAILALGCVIRGETSHFEHISRTVTDALTQLQVRSGIPVALGILTTESLAQALARAGGEVGHLGIQAAESALEMCDLFSRMDSP
jgi:6,7-dimethyl-8-ribityllumazine synthase